MSTRIIAATVILFIACGAPRDQAAARAQSTLFPTGTLDQVLAPIALYPDQLLAQMLISATEPAKITELDKWMKSNTTLKGTQLQDAAVKAGFDASFVALVVFPQVVTRMAEQIAWTTILGQSFTMDKTAVFASIQGLRAKARNVGTLKDTPQQAVETKTTSAGQEVIVIEPTNPQVVYVPQYNPTVVYTQPPTTTTIVVQDDDDDAEAAIAAGLIGFTAGIAIGSMNDNYYYGPCCMYGGAYMYNDAWDDYYDHREDAREDWMDHREDVIEDRSDRLEDRGDQRSDRVENTQEQRTDRQQNRQENRPETAGQRTQQAQGTQRTTQTQSATQRAQAQGATTQGAAAQSRTGTPQARGYSDGTTRPQTTQQRSGSSDAFSGYSSGQSQRATSNRGQTSRSSSRSRSGGGGGGRRR